MNNKREQRQFACRSVVFVHLRNDFGGTSLVLSGIVEGLISRGYQAHVYSAGMRGQGFLSTLAGATVRSYPYRASEIGFFKILNLVCSQFVLFFKLLRFIRKPVVFYVNTMMPYGAMMAGWLMRKRVVVHAHEISVRPRLLDHWCRGCANLFANDVVFVSNFIKQRKQLKVKRQVVVHNALSPLFIAGAMPAPPADNFTVLMLCNLQRYKGVMEFVKIARLLPQYRFELVLNASDDAINAFFKKIRFSENLTVHGAQHNVHPFYERASLVVNLSHPERWLESFGMTVLEAMCYGLPVIVPPRGGISELVVDGENGFHISSGNLDAIVAAIIRIAEEPGLYIRLSEGAREALKRFSYNEMIDAIYSILTTGRRALPAVPGQAPPVS